MKEKDIRNLIMGLVIGGLINESIPIMEYSVLSWIVCLFGIVVFIFINKEEKQTK